VALLARHLSSFPEVMTVRLIGSYHRGDFGPFSDVDIVVVVEESDQRFMDRCEKYRPSSFPVALDLFVYTESEVRTMRQSAHPFWRHIEQNHTLLFQRKEPSF